MKKIRLKMLMLSLLLGGLSLFRTTEPVLVNSANTIITTKADASYLSGYYQTISGSMSGDTLKRALNSILLDDRQTTFGYDSLPTKAYPYTDTDPSRPFDGYIVGYYDRVPRLGYTGMNREHVWPKSHGGNTIDYDPHVIRPTITATNSDRGNKYFAEPPNIGWDPGQYIAEYRGDAARIILYGGVINTSLIIEDVGRGQAAGTGNRMGKLGDLLKWNLQYPVTAGEIIRNETLDRSLSWNRNPFIDDPNLACRIWGDTNTNTRNICMNSAPDPVEKVTVTPNSAIVQLNETLQLTSNILPTTASQSVTWKTSNVNIATIDNTGLLTGKAVGTVSVTATSVADPTKSSGATIYVTNDPIPLQSISFSEPTKTLDIGSTLTLSVNYSPSNASNKTVTWSSSNQTVATISTSGLVTAKAEGTSVITAISEEGGYQANLTLTVKKVTQLVSVNGLFYNTAGNNEGITNFTATNLNNGGSQGSQSYQGFNQVNVVSSIVFTQGYLPRGGGLALGSGSNPGSLKVTLNDEYSTKKVEVLFNNAGESSTPSLVGRSGAGAQTQNGKIGTLNSNPSSGEPYIITFPEKETFFEIKTTKRLAVVEIRIYLDVEDTETPLQHAEKWSQDFINNTNLGCLNKSDLLLSSAWSNAQDAYFALNTEAQDYIQQAMANAAGSIIEHAVARYYVILDGYEYNDFLNGELTKLIRTVNETSPINMFMIAGITYVLAGMLFLIITKKEKRA